MRYKIVNGHLCRTSQSMSLESRRVIKETDTTKYKYSAQEIADEKHLSRSKPYPNKGAQEAARRLARMT